MWDFSSPKSTEAFANPSTSFISPSRASLNLSPVISYLTPSNDHNDIDLSPFTRPFLSAAAPLALSASLIFAPPLLTPTTQAIEPAYAVTTSMSPTATSIDIDLKGLPALTRKAIVNREALQKYLIESVKSFKPILELLSESDAVTVTPPKNIKGAINELLGGEAEIVVNGNNLDVRVESVPGVIIVRVINPNIPRLPFLKDGTATIQFIDKMVDAAPKEIEMVGKEVKAVENFLTWGAPERKQQVLFSDSTLGQWLNAKFTYGDGKMVSLGAMGSLTNEEVVLASLGAGVAGAYGASYSYYVYLREEAEKEAEEKKAASAAKRQANAKEQAKVEPAVVKKVEMKETKPETKPVEAKAPEPVVEANAPESAVEPKVPAVDGYAAAAAKEKESASSAISLEEPKRMRKRDAIKRMFGKKD